MGKKTKKGKTRLDKFYWLAREQGFRSRAAFKLIQLNRQYHFLEKSRALLDLCAAPGGWLQVASKFMPVSSLIVGIDLVPIKPIRGVKTLTGDITTPKARQMIKAESKGSLFDAVIHDGAPNVGGAWASEAYSQSALVLDSLKIATEMLAPGGTFVTKVFRSKDYNSLLYCFQQLFDRVEATKPAASRNTSAEIFVVCLGYKAPGKIDPRLLDHRHLFKEVAETARVMGPDALMRQKIKQKRFREGYEEGLAIVHKPCSAAFFVLTDRPVELLGMSTQFVIEGPGAEVPPEKGSAAALALAGGEEDGEASGPSAQELRDVAALIRSHRSTTYEVKELCKDLQVLGRREFKQLLKWRLEVRKELEKDKKKAGKEGKEAAKDAEEAADPEERLLEEMQQIQERLDKQSKREKKKKKEVKRKLKIRMLGASNEGGELAMEEDLFALRTLRGKKNLGAVQDAAAPDEADLEDSDSDSQASGSDQEDYDSEDERLRYESLMEDYLERSFQQYQAKAGEKAPQDGDLPSAKRRRMKDGVVEVGGDEVDADAFRPERTLDAELDDLGERGAGLLVSYDERKAGRATTGKAMAAQWFNQDLFQNLGEEDEEEEDDDNDEDEDEDGEGMEDDEGEEDDEELDFGEEEEADEDEEEQRQIDRLKAARNASTSAPVGAGLKKGGKKKGQDDGFEVVPAKAPAKAKKARRGGDDSDSDSDSDSGSESGTDADEEFEALPANAKAEVLALAKKMLRGRDRQDVMDAAYNRYAFHDDELPSWFEADEQKHMRPAPELTLEEIEEQKERLRSVDARTSKKVAEAKARKKRQMHVKMQKAKARANQIAGQEDVPMAARMKEIEKVYAKAKREGRMDPKKKKPLDRRMKKEARAQKRIAKDAKKKGGRGGGGKKGGGSKISKAERREMKNPRAGMKTPAGKRRKH